MGRCQGRNSSSQSHHTHSRGNRTKAPLPASKLSASFPLSDTVLDPYPGNGATHNGLDFLCQSAIKTIPYRHAHNRSACTGGLLTAGESRLHPVDSSNQRAHSAYKRDSLCLGAQVPAQFPLGHSGLLWFRYRGRV